MLEHVYRDAASIGERVRAVNVFFQNFSSARHRRVKSTRIADLFSLSCVRASMRVSILALSREVCRAQAPRRTLSCNARRRMSVKK